MLGFDNGVFTTFIKRPNAMLTANKSLPTHEMKVLREAVTDAVVVGLNDLGKEWLTAITTASHLCLFPQDGSSLSGADGVCNTNYGHTPVRGACPAVPEFEASSPHTAPPSHTVR